MHCLDSVTQLKGVQAESYARVKYRHRQEGSGKFEAPPSEVHKQVHTHMTRGWVRYRKGLLSQNGKPNPNPNTDLNSNYSILPVQMLFSILL